MRLYVASLTLVVSSVLDSDLGASYKGLCLYLMNTCLRSLMLASEAAREK